MRLRTVLALVWLVLFAVSLLTFAFVPAEGDGFTRGENRIWIFLGLQVLALLLGVALVLLTVRAGSAASASSRITGFVPGIVSLLTWLLMLAGFFWFAFNFQLGPGDDMTRPPPITTAPAG